ncbi:MAG: MFS transporter [Actinobacteria bacterium]|nr:MFS transporter [Actinomycetota bacterium]
MIDRHHRNLALLVAGCFFMEILDGTIVVTAAPKIGASLGVPATSISLVITAYLVTLAVLIPLSGWVGARFGARPVFLTAIVVFTAASALCAASTSLPELVAFRVLQGVGGAMMVPVGRLVVLAKTPKQELMRMIAFLVWPALIAPVFAPLAGGVITTYASWHWLFLVNVPLGALAFLAALRLIESPPMPPPPPLDRFGVLLVCGGLGALTYDADLLSRSSPPWLAVAIVGAAAVVLLIAASRHLWVAEHPLVNLRTLRIVTFGASIGGSTVFWLAVGAVPFLLPLLFQEVFGWSPVKSGAVVLFVFLGNIVIKPATTYLYGRCGFRSVIFASTAGLAVTLVACAFLTATTPLALIALVALLSGIARSVGSTGYTTLAFSDVPDEHLRDANTLQATSQQLSFGLGVALGAVLLRAGGPLADLLPGTPGDETAYSIAFVLLAIVASLAAAGALRLPPGAGDGIRVRGRGAGRGGDQPGRSSQRIGSTGAAR